MLSLFNQETKQDYDHSRLRLAVSSLTEYYVNNHYSVSQRNLLKRLIHMADTNHSEDLYDYLRLTTVRGMGYLRSSGCTSDDTAGEMRKGLMSGGEGLEGVFYMNEWSLDESVYYRELKPVRLLDHHYSHLTPLWLGSDDPHDVIDGTLFSIDVGMLFYMWYQHKSIYGGLDIDRFIYGIVIGNTVTEYMDIAMRNMVYNSVRGVKNSKQYYTHSIQMRDFTTEYTRRFTKRWVTRVHHDGYMSILDRMPHLNNDYLQLPDVILTKYSLPVLVLARVRTMHLLCLLADRRLISNQVGVRQEFMVLRDRLNNTDSMFDYTQGYVTNTLLDTVAKLLS